MRAGRGAIDTVRPYGERIAVGGYYHFVDFGEVAGLAASVAGQRVAVREVQTRMPSPDIAEIPVSRELPGAERCRFSLVLEFPFDELPEHSLLEIIPLSAHGRGVSLRRLHEIRTPRPDDESIRSIGNGYEEVAAEFLSFMVDLAGLQPDASVLEVGCGIGRMALGLSAFLSSGRYLGLDIMESALNVARATIDGDRRIRFGYLDLYNGWYHSEGTGRALDLSLAREVDGKQDLVFMTSVLTHLFPADAEHYLRECRSVMKPGGALLVTAWLVNATTRRHILEQRSAIAFHEQEGGYWVQSVENPEGAIALEEGFVMGAIERAGLRIERLERGYWADQAHGLTFQDLLILRIDGGGGRGES
ncbi:MAG: class I SAM-dependent methyltransferase [Planctomycetota bacterium]